MGGFGEAVAILRHIGQPRPRHLHVLGPDQRQVRPGALFDLRPEGLKGAVGEQVDIAYRTGDREQQRVDQIAPPGARRLAQAAHGDGFVQLPVDEGELAAGHPCQRQRVEVLAAPLPREHPADGPEFVLVQPAERLALERAEGRQRHVGILQPPREIEREIDALLRRIDRVELLRQRRAIGIALLLVSAEHSGIKARAADRHGLADLLLHRGGDRHAEGAGLVQPAPAGLAEQRQHLLAAHRRQVRQRLGRGRGSVVLRAERRGRQRGGEREQDAGRWFHGSDPLVRPVFSRECAAKGSGNSRLAQKILPPPVNPSPATVPQRDDGRLTAGKPSPPAA